MHPFVVIFGQNIQTYYLCAAAAGLFGAVLSSVFLRKIRQGAWAYFLPPILIASALFGARILNFLTYPAAFSHGFSPLTLSYEKLSLMGGLLAGLAVILFYCGIRKVRFSLLADALTTPAAVGIVLLKLGCFLNGCCFGKPTDGPFGMIFPANESMYAFIDSLRTVDAKSRVVHPTQLYEIIGALAALALALLLGRCLKLKEGSTASVFALVFCAARWGVLPLRELPYEERVIGTFYPILYAVLIVLSFGYLLYLNRKSQ